MDPQAHVGAVKYSAPTMDLVQNSCFNNNFSKHNVLHAHAYKIIIIAKYLPAFMSFVHLYCGVI